MHSLNYSVCWVLLGFHRVFKLIYSHFPTKIHDNRIVVFCSTHTLTNATITMVTAVLGTCKIHAFFHIWKKLNSIIYSFYTLIFQQFI